MKKRPVQKPETVKQKDRNETKETTETTKTRRSKRNHRSDQNETITVVSFN